LLLCLNRVRADFVLTRVITRMIRAGVGPFRNNVSESGVAHPPRRARDHPADRRRTDLVGHRGRTVVEIAAVTIGCRMSLILDEFALILPPAGRLLVERGPHLGGKLIGLTAACMGPGDARLHPAQRSRLQCGDVTINITLATTLAIHAVFVPGLRAQGQVPHRADQAASSRSSPGSPRSGWADRGRGGLASGTSRRRWRGRSPGSGSSTRAGIRCGAGVGNLIAGKVSQPDPAPEAQPALFDPPAHSLDRQCAATARRVPATPPRPPPIRLSTSPAAEPVAAETQG